jgi:tripartite-type tricarboxylate transporter receptor subunit TctC
VGAEERAVNKLACTIALAISMVAPAGPGAWCQPAGTIKIVVPFSPGGVADTLARLLAEQIGRTQGPTSIVENRPGANGIIGTEAVAHAAPNGSTVLLIPNAFLVNPQLRKANYDALADFEPICYLTRTPTVVVVNSSSRYLTLSDLIEAARAKPGEVTLASSVGGVLQIGFVMLTRAAGVSMALVPYPGDAPAVNALLGEHVTSVLYPYSGAVAAQVGAGRLRVLATAAPTRIKLLPDVPTIAEAGYKDFEVDIWFGLMAPARTPKDKLARIAGWFTAALQAPEIRWKLVKMGHEPVGLCGTEFGALVRKQYDDYGRVVREAHITAE